MNATPENRLSNLIYLALLLTATGFGLSEKAAAQTVIRDRDTGAVHVDHNAFDLQTGPLHNDSSIPLPSELVGETHEGVAQPVTRDRLAPSRIDITPDVHFINNSLDHQLNPGNEAVTHTLERDSLQLVTQFNLGHRAGAHAFGEGIEVTVFDANGAVRSRETVFISGGSVTIGPNGDTLPANANLSVTYGADDTVELRVLNLRSDGAAPVESGIYFSHSGGFVVEDLPNGGDLDFNDGDYFQLFGGHGEAQTLAEHSSITYETQVVEIPLEPDTRQAVSEATEVVERSVQINTVTETARDWGQIATPDTVATRLGHARAAYSEQGDLLVYDRYSGTGQVSLGTDGLGLTGQLPPLVSNPDVPPTLLTGSLRFDPTVADNEAGLTVTLGVTQFLQPTHRVAQDVFGNQIVAAGGPPLLEPTGLLANRHWVGYVPPRPSEAILGDPIIAVDNVFEIPAEQTIQIAPPDPQRVGPGNAAYTENVGGLLVEDRDGNIEFIPQWTAAGYVEEPISLAPNRVQRVIYALVPQQPGQSLRLGQRYAVTDTPAGYQIADGGFTIISADRQPQNFLEESMAVYAVEDTLPGRNAVTPLFNGIRGNYVEVSGGAPLPTVDVSLPAEVDARVGNVLFPVDTVPFEPGQRPYAQTTVAAGFYVSGAFTGGVGNQRDTVTRVTSTLNQSVDEVHRLRTTHTFATPRTQLDTFLIETTETTAEHGTASFDITSQGQLSDVTFLPGGIADHEISHQVVEHTRQLRHGEELLLDSVSEVAIQRGDSRTTLVEQHTSTETESYPNLAPVQGELALGGVLNFGHTPWTPAANTLRAEVFVRDVILGRGSGSETGWRAGLVVHPFGERQRPAFQYDEAGQLVPVYQTLPMLDADNQPLMQTLTDDDGATATVAVNQFALDEAGDRLPQTVGTGLPIGPGFYLRVEDLFSGDDGTRLLGGIQFDF
ncbi:hypothetical protein IQ254_07720 [Nodosilinea sp. LEGE 07088]|uniref:hypothetical protein n=1 Tax=Nodosilinea sp. LEGE 07088 TaxID=2777968 RepID=UPI0018815686|nr:hypothetical protein [Nodosilinea sp. LEGE 07088]MBE9137090.1 hypothetical protein [Nodosilinea sp. LEGE 07088]